MNYTTIYIHYKFVFFNDNTICIILSSIVSIILIVGNVFAGFVFVNK